MKIKRDGVFAMDKRDLSLLEFPTRWGAGEVYAYEIRILQGFGVGISTYSRQA
jgi:hypothetical protein